MTSQYKIHQLTKENYDTWKIQAEALLIKNKLWGYVNGSIAAPNDAAELAKWKDEDVSARSDILLMISPSELKQVRNCKTSKEVWDTLKKVYESEGPARKATLLKKLVCHKMNNEDVREHLNEFMDTVGKLEDMDIKIHEDLLTILMLYSLPTSYNNFRVAIETRDTLPKPQDLKIKIIEEGEARGKQEHATEDAFYGRHHKNARANGAGPSSPGTSLIAEEYSDPSEELRVKIEQDFPITTSDDIKVEYQHSLQNTEEFKEVNTVQVHEFDERNSQTRNKGSSSKNNGLPAYETVSTAEKKLYKCPDPSCSRTFAKGFLLRAHMKVHTDEKNFHCQFPGCTKKYKRNYERLKHMKVHSGENQVKCDICSKLLKSKYYLSKHMALHTEDRPYKCPYPDCERSFKMSRSLAEHKAIHCEDKAYKCEKAGCLRSFRRLRALKNHMKGHIEGKKHKCDHPTCPWAFKSVQELNLHKIVHIDDKPYQCEHQGCPKSFKRKCDLKQHMNVHRSDRERLKCERDGCTKTFKWVANLIGHIRTHHPEDDTLGDCPSSILPNDTIFLTDSKCTSSSTNENCRESFGEIGPSPIGISANTNECIDPLFGYHVKEESGENEDWPLEQDYQIHASALPTRINEETDPLECQGAGPSFVHTKTEEYSDTTDGPPKKETSPEEEQTSEGQNFSITTTSDDFKVESEQFLQNTGKPGEEKTVQIFECHGRTPNTPQQTESPDSHKDKSLLVEYRNPQSSHSKNNDLATTPGTAQTVEEKLYKCPDPGCTKTFKLPSQMRRHMMVHCDEKKFKCQFPKCEKRFKLNYERMKHMKSHSGEKPVKCEICSKALKSNDSLKWHMFIHTDKRPFRCSYPGCDKAFKTTRTLKGHKETHREEKAYKCEKPGCLKSFTRITTLKYHMASHNEAKKHKCDHLACPRAFKTEQELDLHKIVHIGDKSYQSENQGCPKLFERKSDSEQHSNVHRSDGERLKCEREGCLKTFEWMLDLVEHVKTHHPEDALGESGNFPFNTNENCGEFVEIVDSCEGCLKIEESIDVEEMDIEDDDGDVLGKRNDRNFEAEFVDVGRIKTDGVFIQ